MKSEIFASSSSRLQRVHLYYLRVELGYHVELAKFFGDNCSWQPWRQMNLLILDFFSFGMNQIFQGNRLAQGCRG